MTEQKQNIYAAICKMQSQFTPVEKNRTVKSAKGFSFKYADLADIWDMIRKPLTENGFSLLQLVQSEEGRNYIITKLIHVSGEMIESKTLIEFTAKQFQEVGAAISYYRRYALSAMLGIVSDEDIDDKPDNSIEKISNTITKEQLEHIESLINGYDDIRQRMVKAFGSIASISVDKYEMIVNSINKLIADKAVK